MSGHLDALTGDAGIRPLTPQEFEQFRKLAYDKFGLDLRPGKEQLVSARLAKRMRQLQIHSYHDYYRHVMEDNSGEALVAMIDALTTNHTSFFRESAHFDFLRTTVIPSLLKRDRISIWSAACSTGEEPYSIAFCLLSELGMEFLPKLQILATDISTRVLSTAKTGAYAAERFRDVPPQQLRQYLLRGEQQWKNWYLVKKEIRTAVNFQRLNLMEPFSQIATFPVIFCRNVMIYFDRPTQQGLVKRLSEHLEPGGHLLIGHAESLNGVDHSLQYVRPAIYRKPETVR
jgi:chemotaxis protein methyltransferase CheR